MFKTGELVWVQTKQYPLWPCTITRNKHIKKDNRFYYQVKFLGEKSTATIIDTDIFEFDISRPEFTPSEEVLKRYKTLKKALLEASKKASSEKAKNSRPLYKKPNQKSLQSQNLKQEHSLSKRNNKESLPEQQHVNKRISVSKSISRIYPPKIDQLSHNSQLQIYNTLFNEKQNSSYRHQFPLPHVEDSDKQNEFEENRQKIISAQDFYKEFEEQLEKRQNNPIQAQANNVPLCSFKYSLPENPTKKNSLSQKLKEKEQYKNQSFIKTLSNYLMIPSVSEQRYLKDLKFKLECIVFLLLDTSPNTDPLLIKLQQLISIFEIQKIKKISYSTIIESKITSILSFINKKISNLSTFSNQKQWIQGTIHTINQYIIRQINNCQFYQKVQQQKEKLLQPSSPNQNIQFINHQQQPLKKQNKIQDLLSQGIIKLNSKEKQFLMKQIAQNMNKYNNHSDDIWNFIEEKLYKKAYIQSSSFYKQFKKFIIDFDN